MEIRHSSQRENKTIYTPISKNIHKSRAVIQNEARGWSKHCCVPQCNGNGKRHPELIFHKFPAQEELRLLSEEIQVHYLRLALNWLVNVDKFKGQGGAVYCTLTLWSMTVTVYKILMCEYLSNGFSTLLWFYSAAQKDTYFVQYGSQCEWFIYIHARVSSS